MSKFKNYKSYLVDIGNTPGSVKDELKGYILAEGWQLLGETATSFDIIPGTPTGNQNGNDVLRIEVMGDKLAFKTAMRKTASISASYDVMAGYNYAYNYSWGRKFVVIINDVEEISIDLTAQLAASMDGVDLRNYILQKVNEIAPSNAAASKFIFTASVRDGRYINVSERVPGQGGVIRFNADFSKIPGYTANTIVETRVFGDDNYYHTVPLNFGTGFIYFMSIFERTISLAIKTTTAYSTIINASFVDNTQAVGNCPTGCIPIELYVFPNKNSGEFQVGFQGDSIISTHGYGYFPPLANNTPIGYAPLNPLTRQRIDASLQFQDMAQNPNGQRGDGRPAIMWSGLTSGYTQNDPSSIKTYWAQNPVVPMYSPERIAPTNGGYIDRGGTLYFPAANLPDTFSFYKDGTEESLHLAQDYTIRTSVTTELAAGDTTLTVGDTSLFPSAGTLSIDSEIVEYTGKTATSFTGLSRGKYGTTASSHIANANVYVLLWYTKIGQGVLLAGYTRPNG